MRMDENRKKKSTKGVGRKPKSDPVVHRYVVRLNSKENGRFDIQLQKSGLKERSKFIKAMIFGREIKVVKIDKRCGAEAKIRPCRAPLCSTVELGRKRAFQHPVPEIRIERTFKIYQGDAFRTRNQGG